MQSYSQASESVEEYLLLTGNLPLLRSTYYLLLTAYYHYVLLATAGG